MIKEITQACITTLINGYERQINNEHIQIYIRMALKGVIGDLGDFLDYATDIKEDVQSTNTEAEHSYYDQIETKDYQITMLKNENLKLLKKIEEIGHQNGVSRNDITNLKEQNRRLQEWEVIYKEDIQEQISQVAELEEELTKLRGPQWKD